MNTDRLARWYRAVEHAAFGKALERARFTYIDRLKDARRVLVLGEGDGRALERMLAAAPQAEFDVIEASGAMIELARLRIGADPRAHFHQADVRSIEFPAPLYDAAVTMFVLDCFATTECAALLSRVAQALKPGAPWLLAEFAVPEHGWPRLHARAWITTMYLFFRATTCLRLTTLPDYPRCFANLGLQPAEARTWRGGLIQSSVLRDIV
jgi:ubiquinone/menaquinone biosynthesis C-methylase UbiE